MTNNEHIECGKHSNIPECCITWFVDHWLPAHDRNNRRFVNQHLKKINRRDKMFGWHTQYVCCPGCMTKKPNRLVYCDCYKKRRSNAFRRLQRVNAEATVQE